MLPTTERLKQLKLLVTANEAIGGGPTQEIEYTFYGRLTNLEQLESAKVSYIHEQWQVPFGIDDQGVKARIREIDGQRWVFTTKKVIPGKLGVEEEECDITPGMFATLRMVAKNGYRKTRYEYPIFGTDRKWEIDVFFNEHGEKSLWVKIDLEVSGPSDPIPKFPVEMTDLIISQGDDVTREEAQFIDNLWNHEWAKLDA